MTPYTTITTRCYSTTGKPLYLACHPDLNGCMAQGYTGDEARRNLDDVREMYIEHYKEHGLPIPPPRSLLIGSVIVFDLKGMQDE